METEDNAVFCDEAYKNPYGKNVDERPVFRKFSIVRRNAVAL